MFCNWADLHKVFVSPNLLPCDPLLCIPVGEGIKDSLEAIVEDEIVQCLFQKALNFVMTYEECGQWYGHDKFSHSKKLV